MSTKQHNAIIIGGGSYGEVLSTYLSETAYTVVGFVDDDLTKIGSKVNGIPVLGSFSDFIGNKLSVEFSAVFCSIGDNDIRSDFLTQAGALGYDIPNFIHKSVSHTQDLVLGKGIYIFPNTTIMPGVRIDDFTMISIGSVITHHTSIARGSLISCGVTIGAFATLKEKCLIGVGATVASGKVTIGKKAIVGTGAIAIKNVEDYAVVVGNPAKVLKYIYPAKVQD